MNKKFYVSPEVGERMRMCMNKAGMTLQDTAEFLDIDRKSLYHYLVGDYAPNTVVLMKFCAKFNVSSDWILGLEK